MIFILAEWNDSTLDATGKDWLWEGPNDPYKTSDSSKWTTQKNDDKLILNFNYPEGQQNKKDIWVWGVNISEPLGYAVDMVEKSDNSVLNDIGTPMFVRNGGESKSGPAYEYNGESQIVTKSNNAKGTLDPGYFLFNKTPYLGNPVSGKTIFKNACAECHGEKADGVNDIGYNAPSLNQLWFYSISRATIKSNIVDYSIHGDGASHAETLSDEQLNDIIAWIRGLAGLPAYYIQKPSGSIADVLCVSNIQTGKINIKNKNGYKVLFTRKLNTGNSDDMTFEPQNGTDYSIDIKLCNADSVNFVGAINQVLKFKNTWDEK